MRGDVRPAAIGTGAEKFSRGLSDETTVKRINGKPSLRSLTGLAQARCKTSQTDTSKRILRLLNRFQLARLYPSASCLILEDSQTAHVDIVTRYHVKHRTRAVFISSVFLRKHF